MSQSEQLAILKATVCGIGYYKSAPALLPREASGPRILARPQQPNFEILGTGFLVRPDLVLTNRHIIDYITRVIKEKGVAASSFYARFNHRFVGGVAVLDCELVRHGRVSERAVDMGMINFRPTHVTNVQLIDTFTPICFADSPNVHAGRPVLLLGYAGGTSLLVDENDSGAWELYRLGPVLLQGHLSAPGIAGPGGELGQLLLDVRVSKGMSGAPVIDAESGLAIGVSYGNVAYESPADAITALANWFSSHTIERLLTAWDAMWATSPDAEIL